MQHREAFQDHIVSKYIVVALSAQAGEGAIGCITLADGSPIPPFKYKVYGPDTESACKEWMERHCGNVPIDLP